MSKKAKAKLKSRDLEAEFESFLNESLSDSSMGSPAHTAAKTKRLSMAKSKNPLASGKKSDRPWWANSDDDDSLHGKEAAAQLWTKKPHIPQIPISGSIDSVDDIDVDHPAEIDRPDRLKT